ncbi:MAG: hypothetical protein AAGJ81_13960 [Verrucomicrobiota bacterium]
MGFPKKFKEKLEKEISDVECFEGAWITWAVCGCSEDACGWEGWILEDVFSGVKGNREHHSASTNQICPVCGQDLFRTGASVKVKPDSDQTPDLIEGVDYETSPIEYDR